MSRWQTRNECRARIPSNRSRTTLLVVLGFRSNQNSKRPPPQSSSTVQNSAPVSHTPSKLTTCGIFANFESILTSFKQSPDRCTSEPLRMRLPAAKAPLRRSRSRKTADIGVSSMSSSRSKLLRSSSGAPPMLEAPPEASGPPRDALARRPDGLPELPGLAARPPLTTASSSESERGTGGSGGALGSWPPRAGPVPDERA
mmetsp:Transcript_21410/g.54691  ORF Transcript_21410/g.54691 Transcript_21410/m.54691 type:complete len:200 (-) Transcript_21410:81-680(-)